jgi:hypothetical protein
MSNFRKQNNKKNLSYFSPLNNYKIIIQNNYYTENSNKILPTHEHINSSKNINSNNNKNLIKLSNNFLYTKRNNKCQLKNKSSHSHSNSNNIIKINKNTKHDSLINNYLKNIVISQNNSNITHNNTMKRSKFSETVKQLKPKKNFDLSEKNSYTETDIDNLNYNLNTTNNKIKLHNKLKNFFKKNIPLSSSNSNKNLNKLFNQNKKHKKNKSLSSSNKIIVTNKMIEDKSYNYNSNKNLIKLSLGQKISNNNSINKIIPQNINQIKNPEELHYFFVNTIQKGKNLEEKFEF